MVQPTWRPVLRLADGAAFHDFVSERRRHPGQGLYRGVRQRVAAFAFRLVGRGLATDLALAGDVGAVGLLEPGQSS